LFSLPNNATLHSWKMLNIAHFQHINQAAGFILGPPALFANFEANVNIFGADPF
jgi:hypothetical protein